MMIEMSHYLQQLDRCLTRLGVLAMVGFGLAVPALAQASVGSVANTPAGSALNGSIQVLAGDTLNVSVFDEPELSRVVRVSADGKANLPLIGDVPVAGLTESEAAHRIDELLIRENFLLHPQTAVFIHDFAVRGVTIVGEVLHPNVYTVQGPRSLLDMIALAGGLTLAADPRINIRHPDGAVEQATISTYDGKLTLNSDVSIGAGDRVDVQRAGMIYVLGDVSRPGGYVMQVDGRLSILEAIAAAGGPNRTAGIRKIVLIHRQPDGLKTVDVPLEALMKGHRQDVALQPNDVLYVPSSVVQNFKANAPQILGTIGGATIYALSNAYR